MPLNDGSLGRMLEHERASNQPIDATPMKLIETLISTQRGWIIRQAVKYASAGAAIATTWLSAHGVMTDGQATAAFFVSLAGGLVEFGLSKMASPIAATK